MSHCTCAHEHTTRQAGWGASCQTTVAVVVLVVLVVDIAKGHCCGSNAEQHCRFNAKGVCKVDGDIAEVLFCMTSAASASSFCVMCDQVASVYIRECGSEQIIAELLFRTCTRFMKLLILHAG